MGRLSALSILIGLAAGCGQPPSEPSDTGSRKIVQDFYEAVIKKDWDRAHGTLDADSQAKVPRGQFAGLAESYCSRLGFEPAEVHIRACEERGSEATAHVTLTGRSGKQTHRYRDGLIVRQERGIWRVVLPEHFRVN